MRKTEINKIIKERIMKLKDSEQMKAFLLEVIRTELRNLQMVKARYSKDYLQSAILQCKAERKGD